ncbi:MAG: AMP-binding protein [Alphaproteobacteria bacterium]|nr:AMP-binding protein [Alphaproteobacteria bacterium]
MYSGDSTISAVLAHRAGRTPDRRLIRFQDGASLTYGALDRDATRLADSLLALGLEPGEKVAVMLANGADFVRAWMALTRAALVEVPLNVGLKGDLLLHPLRLAECRAIVVSPDMREKLDAVAGDLPLLEHVVVAGDGPFAPLPGKTLHRLDDLAANGRERHPAVVQGRHDPAVILFTSGTTGPSKGAVLSHNSHFEMARICVAAMDYGPDDVLFSTFPLFHANARYLTVLAAMLSDAEAVLHTRFSASGFWDICRREGVTAFNYMGALLMMLHKQPARGDDADNPVRRAYGAPAPATICEDFEARFGLRLIEVYGSTELGTVTLNGLDGFRLGSCGRPVPLYDVQIQDENGLPCPPGQTGEIVARPRQPDVMFKEYYRMPDATVKAFRDLWFHTGDRGRTDEDGYFYYVDRMKDAIRRRGENISSWEVEKVIDGVDGVQEAAVFGVPSELSEEEVMTAVVRKPGAALEPAAILDRCQERLPWFAVPRYVRFVDALPRNTSERIEKYKLRDAGVTPDTWDREAAGYVVRR